MLVYDQPINQAKPDDLPARGRTSAGFSVLELIRCCGGEELRLRRPR